MNFDNIDNINSYELYNAKLNKRLSILREFLDDKTIKFILENNFDFLNKISIQSLQRSAYFYSSLENFDYISIIKWYPILLDFDRFNLLMKYFKKKNIPDDKIVQIIEKNVMNDFDLADVIVENDYKITENDYLNSVDSLKIFLNYSKAKNETFNNFIKNDINKYSDLLRKLK